MNSYMRLHHELFLRGMKDGVVDYDQLYADMDVALPTEAEVARATRPGFKGAMGRWIRMMTIIGPGGRARYDRDEIVDLYLRAHQPQDAAPRERTWRDVHQELITKLSFTRRSGEVLSIDEIFHDLGIPIPTEAELAAAEHKGYWHAFGQGLIEGVTMMSAGAEQERAWRRCVRLYALEKRLAQIRAEAPDTSNDD